MRKRCVNLSLIIIAGNLDYECIRADGCSNTHLKDVVWLLHDKFLSRTSSMGGSEVLVNLGAC